ncbi:MAG: nucleoside recognition domain-containing protein [Desulfomonilia bacterium]
MEETLTDVLSRSGRKSLEASWSILIIMIPISLGMTILQYTGVMEYCAGFLSPVMRLFSLPAEASLVLIAGALINIYAGIAVMIPLGLDVWSITIIAVMMLICHNLVVESAVQSKTGVSGLIMTVFRIAAAAVVGIVLSFILPEEFRHTGVGMGSAMSDPEHGLSDTMLIWIRQTSELTIKVILIIAGITLLIDVMRFFKAFAPVVSLLRPFTSINGLPRNAAFMWMAGLVFGLAYGSGVLIAEARTGQVDKDALIRLNLSLGISHSLIEDTLLFVALGASLFWVIVPRIIAAALMVWVYVLGSSIVRNMAKSKAT